MEYAEIAKAEREFQQQLKTVEKQARIEYHALEALIHLSVAYYEASPETRAGKKLAEALASTKAALSGLNDAP